MKAIFSILRTVRKLVGLYEDDTSFDTDLLIYINTAFQALNEIGIGPEEVFSVEDESTLWTDFTKDTIIPVDPVKTYVCNKVKLAFDPPANTNITQSIQRVIDEAEWRLSILVNKA